MSDFFIVRIFLPYVLRAVQVQFSNRTHQRSQLEVRVLRHVYEGHLVPPKIEPGKVFGPATSITPSRAQTGGARVEGFARALDLLAVYADVWS